jgi:hypothetical protein
MFLHSIPKMRCVTDVKFSIELTSQHINLIHISPYCGALTHVRVWVWRIIDVALNYVEFRAAMHPTWYMAEREGFEPSIPLLAGYTISNRAPSASRASLLFKQYFRVVNSKFGEIFKWRLILRTANFELITCFSRCLAERVGFEPTSRDYREPLFESGALSQLGNLSFHLAQSLKQFFKKLSPNFKLFL